MTLEAEGAHERAQFWFVMLILLGDINAGLRRPGRAHHHPLV